jgi:hypothetical protein
VPVEKHEVRYGRSVDRLVDAKEVLDRRSSAAFLVRIEGSNAN